MASSKIRISDLDKINFKGITSNNNTNSSSTNMSIRKNQINIFDFNDTIDFDIYKDISKPKNSSTNIKNNSTNYGRPWTSPKKAIDGGAEFIVNSYIAKGQFTSYLKKFNVNPKSNNEIYSHQYMDNIEAPSEEAKSTFISYRANGLLDAPLHFFIPTYENMPTSTILSDSNISSINKTNISDIEFEKKLDSQEFDESYKIKLRELHKKYSNWTFENMKTGLDFSEAVSAEQKTCSISGNPDYYYVNENGNYVQTEKGWYRANNATVSYYLDPRNFLNEDGIIMFEDLKYSSDYTESTVQKVLDHTFMEDYSALDNQSYASIFVESGKKNNINPIYLASLAKQESGENGSLATTGEVCNYEGKQYQQIFNFFNIGAYSNQDSPIKAGIAWASSRDIKN